MGDQKLKKKHKLQSIHSRLTFWHAPTMGSLECDTGLGDAVKIYWWPVSNTSTYILLLSRSPRRGRAWNRQKFSRFEILFKLPTAIQPCWKYQASDESAFEDRCGLNLEIFDLASSEIQQFLLKLLVTFGFHSSSNTKGDGTVDGLASWGEFCIAEMLTSVCPL